MIIVATKSIKAFFVFFRNPESVKIVIVEASPLIHYKIIHKLSTFGTLPEFYETKTR